MFVLDNLTINMNDDECFPRGRPAKVSSISSGKNVLVDKSDNLFKEMPKIVGEKFAKSKKRETELDKAGWSLSAQKEIEEDECFKVKSVDFLHFKKLHEGMLVLGCVKSIHELELVISLPNCLTGYVKANRISSAYTSSLKASLKETETENVPSLEDMFHIGQLLTCSVYHLDPQSKSIQLSLDPEVVNQSIVFSKLKPGMMVSGAVKSIEDHGFVMDVGRKGIKAFMASKFSDNNTKLALGSVTGCVVLNSSGNGTIITLSNDEKRLNKVIAKPEHEISLDTIFPGTLVKITPTKTFQNGFVGKFLEFYGSVSILASRSGSKVDESSKDDPEKQEHEPKKKRKRKDFDLADNEESSKFAADGKASIACVLYVTQGKHVVLSTNPYLWHSSQRIDTLMSYKEKYPIGHKCKVKVQHVVKGIGILCQTDRKGPVGVIQMQNISDNKSDEDLISLLDSKFLKVRVIEHSSMDGVLQLSMKKSIMDAAFFRYEDVEPGSLVQAKITLVEQRGLQVAVGSGQGKDFKHSGRLRAYIPAVHMSDIILQHPEKKFNEGDTLNCRVLTVDASRRHLHLTNKPTLVHSKLPIVTSFEQLNTEDILHGFIVSVKEIGCVVRFYNNVHGFVPKNELSTDEVESPEKTFFVGQIMKCRVLSCEPQAERLLLSFCLKPKQSQVERRKVIDHETDSFRVGQLVDVKVQRKNETGFKVKIVESSTDASVRFPATLPTMHLSDFRSVAESLLETIHTNSIISNCVVLSTKTPVTVSMKPSLVRYALKHDSVDSRLCFADLHADMTLPGFVRFVADYGVFVEFPSGLVGLCPKSAMTDHYLPETINHYFVGQSVVAMITSVDQEKKRFVVTLRPTDCPLDEDQTRSDCYFQELSLAKSLQGGGLNLAMGQVVDITMKDGEGSVCTIDGLDEAKYSTQLCNWEGEATLNDKAVVLFCDKQSGSVFLCNGESIVRRYQSSDHDEIRQEKSCRCHVIYMNEDVAVGYSESDDSSKLICVSAKTHWNESSEPALRLFKTDETVQVRIRGKSEEGILYGELKLKGGVGKRVRQDSELSDSTALDISQIYSGLRVGQEVQGTVKSIRATYALITLDSLARVCGRHLVGRLHISEVEEDPEDQTSPLSKLKVGTSVSCHVIGCRDVRTHKFLEITNRKGTRGVPELSLFRSSTPTNSEMSVKERYPVASEVTAFVKRYDKKFKALRMEVDPSFHGILPRLLVSDKPNLVKKCETKFRSGRALRCVVVRNDGTNVVLSKKGAMIDAETGLDVTRMQRGCVMNGEIRKVVNDGLLIHTEFETQGRIFITDISDDFVDKPTQNFFVGEFVRCCVMDDSDRERLVLSMRQSVMRKTSSPPPVDPDVCDASVLKANKILRGYVKSTSSTGIFVTLSRNFHGRVTFEQATKFFLQNKKKASEVFYPGRLVATCVKKFSPQDGRVELSMLEKDTGKADAVLDSLNLPLRGSNKRKANDGKDTTEIEKKKRKQMPKIKSSSKASVEAMIAKTAMPEKQVKIKTAKAENNDGADPGFVWTNDGASASQPSDEDEDSGIEDVKLVTRKSKKLASEAERATEELQIQAKEKELMDKDKTPESVTEWERLMISNPQNSMLWVRYMAFFLHATEIDKARVVGERALKTISFREEKEKLNVWVALLNLENLYGTDQSLDDTLERSLQQNNQLKVLTHLAQIFTQSGKREKADEVYKRMSKKFRQDKEVWMSYIRYLMNDSRHEEANEIFKRSIRSLDKKNHLEVISKFGQLEFSLGDAERGRTIFENALSNFPKRTDIWSIYIDTLIKAKKIEEARNAFDRVTTLSISNKKIKSFFKRFIDFETKYGTDSSVAIVRQKALTYIESETARLMDD